MGLGNHKHKMSISLTITLILSHTVEKLVQMHATERKLTTSYDIHPIAPNPQVTRLEGFPCKVTVISIDRTAYMFIFFPRLIPVLYFSL